MRTLGIVLAGLLVGGCGREPRRTLAASRSPIRVTTVVAQEIEWPSVYRAIGTVRARVSTSLASKVMGYIREMRVNAGDYVSPGQLLAIIDSRDLEAGLRQARAAVEEARSGVAGADNSIAAAKAQLELAAATFTRMADLFEKRSISNQEFDEVQSRFRVAQAGYEMALSNRRQLEARIQQAEQAEHAAAVTRSYAEIRAPFSGVITAKRAEQGDLAAPGMPLMTVEQSGGYQLEVAVEEAKLGIIRAGAPVTVVVDAFADTIGTRVTEIVPAIDPSSRTFTVKVRLPSDARFRSGLFGRALFTVGSRRAVVVSESAIATMGQVHYVSVVENGVARSRLVSVGERRGDMTEVLSGVSAGDRIVTPRPAGLVDGSRVEVRS